MRTTSGGDEDNILAAVADAPETGRVPISPVPREAPESIAIVGTGGPIAAGPSTWIGPLVAMMLLQTTGAFLNQLLATMAPILGPELGWSKNTVGYLVAIGMAGSIAFLICGSPFVRGLGPIRAVQIGLGLGILGIALLPVPMWVAPFGASLLIGLAYGPSTPAGSDVLQRYAPARHRSLIFSIKQAGVPLGGAAAGLILPTVATLTGWREALLLAGLMIVAAVLAVQPVRGRIDAERDSTQPLGPRHFLSLENVRRPFLALRAGSQLPTIALAGGFLAINQGGWNAFLMTYLVSGLGISIQGAGVIFAIMQVSGIVGRILLGWAADRIRSGLLVVRAAAATSALTSAMLALSTPDWPLWSLALLAAVAGMTVSGWNGVQLAEIARRTPRNLIGEASAGGTVLVFLGFAAGPSTFALILAGTGRFDSAYLVLAVLAALAFFILMPVKSGLSDTTRSS